MNNEQKTKQRILAIDHGTTSGIASFVDGKYHISEVLHLGDISDLIKAYREFERVFYLLIPNVVVVEKVNVSGAKFGGETVIKLAQLQAMIKLLAQRFNCKIIEINPMSMKKHIAGSGRAEKQDVAEAVARRWNLNPKHICVPEYFKRKEGIKRYHADESDAIALGTYALDKYCTELL